MTDFAQQTAEFADKYRDFVVNKTPIDLTDLAHFVKRREGALEALDGSLGSLDTLASMVIDWIAEGLLDIPGDLPLTPDSAGVTLGDRVDSEGVWSRAQFIRPWIEAFVLQVCTSLDGGARLAVFTHTRGQRVVDGRLNQTGIELSDETWISLAFVHGFLRANVYPRDGAGDPTRLRRSLLEQAPTLQTESQKNNKAGNGFDLLHLSELPEFDSRDPRRIPPAPDLPMNQITVQKLEPRPRVAFDDVYLIARGRADGLDEPSAFRPLPLADITTWLASLGAPTSGLVDALALASDEFETSMGELVVLQLALAKGSVRAIFIERADATDDEWIGFCMGAKKFAKSVRARFGTEDEWPE